MDQTQAGVKAGITEADVIAYMKEQCARVVATHGTYAQFRADAAQYLPDGDIEVEFRITAKGLEKSYEGQTVCGVFASADAESPAVKARIKRAEAERLIAEAAAIDARLKGAENLEQVGGAA